MTFSVSETVELSRWWWTFILRGLLAIAFGILAFIAPVWGVAILVALFGAWALIDGVTNVWTGIRTRNVDRNWWLEILEGLVSVAAGVIAFCHARLRGRGPRGPHRGLGDRDRRLPDLGRHPTA